MSCVDLLSVCFRAEEASCHILFAYIPICMVWEDIETVGPVAFEGVKTSRASGVVNCDFVTPFDFDCPATDCCL